MPIRITAAPRARAARVKRQNQEVRDAVRDQIVAPTLLPELQQQPRRGIELAATREQESQIPEQHEKIWQENS